eukprot:7904834-Ditylum_brightwellii.AAC.1
MQYGGRGHVDHLVAEGQTRTNNDFGCDHKALISGRKSKSGPKEREYGSFHKLPYKELQQTLIIMSKENTCKMRKIHNEALEKQLEMARCKEQIKLEKQIGESKEEYID